MTLKIFIADFDQSRAECGDWRLEIGDCFLSITLSLHLSISLFQFCLDTPILYRDKILYLAFAFDDEPHGDRLHASRTQRVFFHFLGQQRADGVADDSVQHAARLLCVYASHVERARMRERVLNRVLCNFVKLDAMNRFPRDLIFQHGREMPRNRFAFAVGVGGKINFARALCVLAQFLNHIAFFRSDFVLGFEIVFNVHAQIFLRQIANVSHRRAHAIIASEKFGNRFCLRGRFDNDEGVEDGERREERGIC